MVLYMVGTNTPPKIAPPVPTPVPAVAQAQSPGRPPVVTLLKATLNAPVTTYSVTATDPDGGSLAYAWAMAGEQCGTPRVPWKKGPDAGPTVLWSHAAGLPDNCIHTTTDHAVTLSVTVTNNRGVSAQCVITGSETISISNPKCQ